MALYKVGILVGGYIIAKIAGKYLTTQDVFFPIGLEEVDENPPPRYRNWNPPPENRVEVPQRRDHAAVAEEGAQNGRTNRIREHENIDLAAIPIQTTISSSSAAGTSSAETSDRRTVLSLHDQLPNHSHHDQFPIHSCKPPPSSEPGRPLTKPPILRVAPTNSQAKTSYVSVEEDAGGSSPIYEIPEDVKALIKTGNVPGVLNKPLSFVTYKDYFDALLYAEDYYIEKWDGFEMRNVTLKLHEAEIRKSKGKLDNRNVYDDEKEDKVFVEFAMDAIPERRPFLLSRDFVFVRPSGNTVVDDPFQGIVYRVLKSNLVLVEFGKDFHRQHYPARNYNVKFSFNRVCLKRAHQAIAAALNPSFRNFLFPDSLPQNSVVAAQLGVPVDPGLDQEAQVSAIRQILSHKNAPPYLVEGNPSTVNGALSRTGLVVCEAISKIYRTNPSCRILVCAPLNSTCDVITRSLKEKKILESHIFRANAAFRELDGVPLDILPTCQYKKDCFACPSLQKLRRFKVILSTFMSSFRLHDEGIMAGHFTHIFLVDASSTTEPETMVALANMANERTAVTMTGACGNHSRWIRSDIARKKGLMTSYFERLRESELYKSRDPRAIAHL